MEKNDSNKVLRGVLILIFGVILLLHSLGLMQQSLTWFLGFFAIYLIIYGLIKSGLWESLKEIWYKNTKTTPKESLKENNKK